ncbi:unnamed protein product [Arctogadus glacialis]
MTFTIHPHLSLREPKVPQRPVVSPRQIRSDRSVPYSLVNSPRPNAVPGDTDPTSECLQSSNHHSLLQPGISYQPAPVRRYVYLYSPCLPDYPPVVESLPA